MTPSRRRFLKRTTAAAAMPALAGPLAAAGSRTGTAAPVYEKLGVKPVINGMGTVTILGGSVMHPEVLEAMNQAAQHYVYLPDLQVKAGEYIARLIGVPACMIACGAASAITCGTAACVTLGDQAKLGRLPNTAGMKNEIVIQKAHRCGYEAQMELVGTRFVWVETREELDRAINQNTAMMFYLNKNEPDGRIKREEWVRVARERGVPTLNDAAADVPPASRLKSYVVDEGFDLVVFSGGKGLFGPQGTGLLLGRQDLVAAAQKSISPFGGIGRGMKVGKEEIAGVVAAVERYLKADHPAERRVLDQRAADVLAVLQGLPGVEARKHVPEIANHVPHVVIEWKSGAGKPSPGEVLQKLREGDPPIYVGGGREGLTISMWTLRGDEHKLVARRIKEMLG